MPGQPAAKNAPLLTAPDRALFGSADAGISAFNTMRQLFFALFLTDVVGLPPQYAAYGIAVGALLDAANDPIVGALSDRVRSRMGRRKPFLLLFSLPFAASFGGLWAIPALPDPLTQTVAVIVTYALTDLMQSLVSIPYYALVPELTYTYDDRTSLTSWRMFFNVAASLVVAVAYPAFTDYFASWNMGGTLHYILPATAFGAASAVPFMALALRVQEPPPPTHAQPPLREALRGILKNKLFLHLLGLFVLNWAVFDLVGLVFPYYISRIIELPGHEFVGPLGIRLPLTSASFGVMLSASIVTFPLWNYISKRMEKSSAYALAAAIWGLTSLSLFWLPPGHYAALFFFVMLAGVGIAGAHILPDAMIPDVIDWGEVQSGARYEATYYGVRNLTRKISGALAAFFALQVIGWAGYRETAGLEVVQPESALLAIRALVSFSGPVLLILAMALAATYPLNRARHRQVLTQRDQQRAM